MTRDNIIIFGAGASHGSDDPKTTPPLGNDLYEKLLNSEWAPNLWRDIPDRIIPIIKKDFEIGMKKVYDLEKNLIDLQKSMAAYFFPFTLQPSNLYMKLIKRMKDNAWSGACITLNYERLLEKALEKNKVKWGISKIDQIKNDKIEVCFPHGCCNFFTKSIQAKNNSIKYQLGSLQFGGNPTRISNDVDFWDTLNQQAFLPAMSFFVPEKDTPNWKQFMKGQRNRTEELIMNAKNIVIIGIQVRPHDSYIWGPLAKTSAKITYCSGTSGGIQFKKWSKGERRYSENQNILEGYWNNNFEILCKEAELS